MQTLKKTLGLISRDTLFVNNFPYHFEEADLESLFKDCGKVVSVRLPEDRLTHKSKGFAFVVMENDKAAKKALNYDGHKVMNRPLRVRLADPMMDVPGRPKVETKEVHPQRRERKRSRSRSDSPRRRHRHSRRRRSSDSSSSSSDRRRTHRSKARHSRLDRKTYREDSRRGKSDSSSESSGFDDH